MNIEIIDNIESLKQQKNAWGNILSNTNNGNPYIEIDWLVNWWNFLGENHQMLVIKICEGAEIIAYCPFMITHKKWFNEINFIGHGSAAFNDFIILPDKRKQVIRCVTEFLLELPGNYFVNLYGMLENFANYIIFTQYLAQKGINFHANPTRCYYIDINRREFNSFFKNMFGKSSRQTMLRKEKRLERLGKLTFNENETQAIDEIFELHKKRWRSMLGSKNFSRGLTKEFFKSFIVNKNDTFNTFINTLKLNDRILAFVYCYECNGYVTLYSIAHDDDFSIFSPGEIVCRKTIESCFNNSKVRYDFGGGYEPYKAKWTNDFINVNTITFPTGGLFTRLFFAKLRLEKYIKNKFKTHWGAIHFRRHILGKILYFFSKEFILDKSIKYKGIFDRKGLYGMIDSSVGSRIKRLCFKSDYLLLHRYVKDGVLSDAQNAFEIQQATIDNIDELSAVMELKPSDIARRFLNGNKCFFIKSHDEIICCLWISFSIDEWYAKCFINKPKEKIGVIDDIFLHRSYDYTQTCLPIVNYILKWLHSNGFEKCYVLINKNNKKFTNSLTNAGFKSDGKLKITKFLGKLYYFFKKH